MLTWSHRLRDDTGTPKRVLVLVLVSIGLAELTTVIKLSEQSELSELAPVEDMYTTEEVAETFEQNAEETVT